MPVVPHFLTAVYGIEVSCFRVHGLVLARISRVVYILAVAVKRVVPIFLKPLTGGLVLCPFQWGIQGLSIKV